jgi:Na+/H+ antiporter NhaD/arsenite permease-like protein
MSKPLHEAPSPGLILGLVQGPLAWLLAAVVGLVVGGLFGLAVPGDTPSHAAPRVQEPAHTNPLLAGHADEDPSKIHTQDTPAAKKADSHASHGPAPQVRLWMAIPFALLLGAVALMPFISHRFWHEHYPNVSLFLGGVTAGYYLIGFRGATYALGLSYGGYSMLHSGLEYYAFMALVGGLYVASGGVLVRVEGRASPFLNTALLAFGAVAANIVGTTGASVLLIRPFMRINEGRLRPIHVIFFIFIVSNCGGCLTPIGDPPLYLGYIKGIPFEWTILNLWPMWLVSIGVLLAMFYVIDKRIPNAAPVEAAVPAEEAAPEGNPRPVRTRFSISGGVGLTGLALIILGVFIDPALVRFFGVAGYPIGATFQLVVAVTAFVLSPRAIRIENGFTFEPVKEVGLLFAGIFATMTPALGYLAQHGAELGLDDPSAYYFMTGLLSGVLDNAPTYLNFLQVAFSSQHLEMNAEGVPAFLASPSGSDTLAAISLGAVFFGAMTYIGNGPNFMVKSIAEAGGLRMPSFFGYVGHSCLFLAPVLVLNWAIFIR